MSSFERDLQNPRTRGVSLAAEAVYRQEEDWLNQPLTTRQERNPGTDAVMVRRGNPPRRQNMAGIPSSVDPYSAQTSVNAQQDRFKVLSNPGLRQIYEEQARALGMHFGPQTELSPLIITETTTISTTTATHPNIPIALNADVPTQRLRYYFQDGAFIRRVTATIIATVLTADGQPSPGFFQNINPLDYVYAQFRRDGAGQIFQTRRMPLSAMAGDGAHSYFFNLIPAVQPGGSILLELSIIPPIDQIAQAPPPFVDRIGQVTVDLHAERFNAFGV